MKKIFVFACLLVFIPLFFYGCKKDYHSSIPYMPVDCRLYPNLFAHDYCPIGTSILINDRTACGYKGLLVFRISDSYFLAFDACCPLDVEKSKPALVIDAGKSTAHCPTCNTKYRLLDGNPAGGATSESLLQYNCDWNGSTGELRIYN